MQLIIDRLAAKCERNVSDRKKGHRLEFLGSKG
jgi:hypothetical protein